MDDRIEFLELRIKQISIQLQGLEVAISQLFRLVCEPLEPPPALSNLTSISEEKPTFYF